MTRWDVICRELTKLSAEVYRWAVSQTSVGEESLTDWLLYTASERLPFVRYHKFTRHQEARDSGADWDWWFVDNHQAFGLRIQAKRLRPLENHYASLAHRNRYRRQIDLLRESAKKANLVALYSFYSSESNPTSILCGGGAISAVGQGVFLASAGAVYKKLFSGKRGAISAGELVGIANPLPCLACCSIAQIGSPDRPVASLYRHFERYFPDETHDSELRHPGIHESPPPYVASLLRRGREESGETWDREFAENVPGTKAIFVVSLSE
jgi:hypothetical protein